MNDKESSGEWSQYSEEWDVCKNEYDELAQIKVELERQRLEIEQQKLDLQRERIAAQRERLQRQKATERYKCTNRRESRKWILSTIISLVFGVLPPLIILLYILIKF